MSLERLEPSETARIRAAIVRARKIYPEPVALLITNELTAWTDMGYRFGGAGLVIKLIKVIMDAPLPEGEPAEPIRVPMKGPTVPKPRVIAHTPLPKPANAPDA